MGYYWIEDEKIIIYYVLLYLHHLKRFYVDSFLLSKWHFCDVTNQIKTALKKLHKSLILKFCMLIPVTESDYFHFKENGF